MLKVSFSLALPGQVGFVTRSGCLSLGSDPASVHDLVCGLKPRKACLHRVWVCVCVVGGWYKGALFPRASRGTQESLGLFSLQEYVCGSHALLVRPSCSVGRRLFLGGGLT